MVEVRVVNAEMIAIRLTKKEAKAKDALRRGILRALVDTTRYIKEDLLSGQVLKNQTGNLRRAVFFKMSGDEGRIAVGKEAPYGKLHEYGVDHSWEIRPRRRKALSFEVNGERVFARRVTHPGLKERSFMRRAIRDRRETIVAMIREEIARAVR